MGNEVEYVKEPIMEIRTKHWSNVEIVKLQTDGPFKYVGDTAQRREG